MVPHKRLLHPRAGFKLLLALVPKALDGLLLLWRAVWVILFCYKLCWEAAFDLVQEACSSMTSWLEDIGEAHQGDGLLSSPTTPEPQEAGAEKLGKMVQMLQESSSAMLGQLVGLEAEVQHISQELRAEKLLWSSRYLELLREQQELLVQFQRQDQTLWLQDMEGKSDAQEALGCYTEAGGQRTQAAAELPSP
ncbi:Hypothetical predicted protein [Podarcis lilfordi]|uniref:Uncharacterized protein n=1 Tax=Podarcis lilfordi TaxID=74358 RepID=A0AA35KQQ2_9SAUR|nr:Hypothetical predicted protein [Podarcis lilfordi]